jgi:hypothetical protein
MDERWDGGGRFLSVAERWRGKVGLIYLTTIKN